MLTAVVTLTDRPCRWPSSSGPAGERGHGTRDRGEHEFAENDLNPIFPEVKELVWGFGSFVVLAVLDALLPVPAAARRDGRPLRLIQGDTSRPRRHRRRRGRRRRVRRPAGRGQGRGAAARSKPPAPTLEAERAERLAEVNARIAEKRARRRGRGRGGQAAARPTSRPPCASRRAGRRAGHRAGARRPTSSAPRSPTS